MVQKDALPFWNHNAAYYGWIKDNLQGYSRILDVGCGDGALAGYLADDNTDVVAIDPFSKCIETAKKEHGAAGAEFFCVPFEDFAAEPESFDAAVFVASIHHMELIPAIRKTVGLLRPGGRLLIVGCASPSSAFDKAVEVLRVVPSAVSTAFHRSRSSEELSIPTSYSFNTMDEIRSLIKTELPGAKLRYGLHYRYLLSWTK